MKKLLFLLPISVLAASVLSGCGGKDKEKRVLRILNSEDYIYEYEDGDEEYATGAYDYQMDMMDQFVEYWKDLTGEDIDYVYDTFDTNETMFNELKTGKTTYDVCIPSDYMIQKLLANGMLHKFIDEEPIWKNISPFIEDKFKGISALNPATNEEESILYYSVPYMWGTMGIMFNPSYYEDKGISEDRIFELMDDWDSLYGEELVGSFSIKDSVRDSYAVSLIHTFRDEIAEVPYEDNATLTEIFNRSDAKTIEKVKADMMNLKENAFGFETDSGKTDMTTQKIGANMCWSGDATWAITEARDNDLELYYNVPTNGGLSASNLWFDCFCMPDNGDSPEAIEQYKLGEAFIEFMCHPDIAAQNAYCVGYTPAVAGDAMLDFIYDCYDVRGVVGEEAEEGLVEGEDYVLYDLSYFYEGSLEEYTNEDAILWADVDYVGRELTAQYPTKEMLPRLSIMNDFGTEGTARLLDMWESVRTNKLPVWAIVLFALEGGVALGFVALVVTKKVVHKKLKKARN